MGEDTAEGDTQFWNCHDPVYISTPKGKHLWTKLTNVPSALVLGDHMAICSACLWLPFYRKHLACGEIGKCFPSHYIFCRGSTVLFCMVLWKISRLLLQPLLHTSCGLFPRWWKLVMLHMEFFLLTVLNSRFRLAAIMGCLAATRKFN